MKKKYFSLFLVYAMLTIASLFFIFPVIWIFATSFKNPVDARSFFSMTFPLKIENYTQAWKYGGFAESFYNTFIISVGTVAISLFAGFLMAYALVRSPISKGFKKFLNGGINSMRMIPEMVFLIPLFILYQKFGLYDRKIGMILAFQVLTLPYCIMLLCNFISQIPVDLEQAARIDGCSEGQVIIKVVLPLSLPGIMTSGILAFITVWTCLMIPLALGYSNAQTIAVSISNFKGYGTFNWPMMAAAAMLVTLPQIVLFGFCNKYLIAGYTLGAVKE